ncbi:MAG: hypothetical protein LH615_14585 [Ferruginibacter sp.]|nr:hypothetical protein [Ferruginibacter sp.]
MILGYSNNTSMHYGEGGTAFNEFSAIMHGENWYNSGRTVNTTNQVPTLNAYLAAIESFNPNSNADYPWIPKGLPYDLFDATAEGSPVIDNVSGYSYQSIFNALQSDVRSVPAFKDRLLQQNGNNQLGQVNALLDEYNY